MAYRRAKGTISNLDVADFWLGAGMNDAGWTDMAVAGIGHSGALKARSSFTAKKASGFYLQQLPC